MAGQALRFNPRVVSFPSILRIRISNQRGGPADVPCQFVIRRLAGGGLPNSTGTRTRGMLEKPMSPLTNEGVIDDDQKRESVRALIDNRSGPDVTHSKPPGADRQRAPPGSGD